MFTASAMLYLYVETPLHAGSGGSVGLIDLPIQRERITHFPLVQASGVKGKLRAEAKEKLINEPDGPEKIKVVFGPEDDGSEHAGALSPGDARLLLFPVRSLAGVFAYTTSRNVLARFRRDLEALNKPSTATWTLDELPDDGVSAWTVDNASVVANHTTVVLQEFSFPAKQHNDGGRNDVKAIADWLADNALPPTHEYEFFKNKLKTNLVILPEDAFRDFTEFATEIVARIKINQETKTVDKDKGALWTQEHLPSDTLLYSTLYATRPRTETRLFNDDTSGNPSAEKVIDFVRDLAKDLRRVQLGGDETVGRGIVRLHLP